MASSSKSDKNESENSPFQNALKIFLHYLDSLHRFLPVAMRQADSLTRLAQVRYGAALKQHAKVIKKEKSGTTYVIPLEKARIINRLRKQNEKAGALVHLLPKNFLVAYINEFDTFTGKLFGALVAINPDSILKEKEIKYAELTGFSSIEDIKSHFVQKETEAFLRDSIEKRIVTIKNRIGIDLFKHLPFKEQLIELHARRNLVVHTDQKITKQYLERLRHNKIPVSGKEGDKITITSKYMQDGYACLYDSAIRMAHILWRKVAPQELEQADDDLNYIGYELIKADNDNKADNDELAKNVFNFASSLPKHSDELHRKMFRINKAQVLKFSGNSQYAEILKEEDWSAASPNFRLCVAVLNEEFKEAADIMRDNKDAISEDDYKEWPIFREFRKSLEFKNAYKEIFDKSFTYDSAGKIEFEGNVKRIDELLNETQKSLDEMKKIKASLLHDRKGSVVH